MALSRLQTAIELRAVKKFTDRDDAKYAFSRALETCTADSSALKVLHYYGVGGIGKTALLRELASIATDLQDAKTALVDLEAPQFTNVNQILLDIWRQLHADCPRFEYALTRALTSEGRSLKDIRPGFLNRDSLLFDLQEVAASLAEVVAPARLIRRLFEIGDEKRRRYLTSYKGTFDEIDSVPDGELATYLPHYLGSDMARWATRSKMRVIVLVDTLDRLSVNSQFHSTKGEPDDWLRELIGSAHTGLFVLAGRDFLKWGDQNPEWEPYLEQHFVGRLTDRDADYFLSGIPVSDPEIRKAIVESSKGIPLYLDLCANTYLARHASGEALVPADFRTTELEVIRRFLAHLDVEHQEALRAMALLERFDEALFGEITRRLNIQFPITLYPEFCDSSYAVPIQSERGLYRIHDVVRSFIVDEARPEIALLIRDCVVTQMEHARQERQFDRANWLFAQVYEIAKQYDLAWSDDILDALLDCGLALIDSGHWNAVHYAISTLSAEWSESAAVRHSSPGFWTFTIFLRAYSNRKRGALLDAESDYALIEGTANLLRRRQPLFRYLHAHTRHLLGEYGKAASIYQALSSDATTGAPVSQLARRQLADVQMMRGQFVDALVRFAVLQDDFQDDPLWQAETYRFRGHVYRFNFWLKDAEHMYNRALEVATACRADAMEGKVLTNLAETLCWVAPHQAAEMATRAIERNHEVMSPIEVGKAYAAQAISFAVSNQYRSASAAAAEAMNIHESCGYRAGVLFGLQAEGLAQILSGNSIGATTIIEQMRSLSQELTVYAYLTFVLSWLMSGTRSIGSKQFQWLDFSITQSTLNGVFSSHAILPPARD